MNQSTLVVLLAALALVLGLVALFVFYRFVIKDRNSAETGPEAEARTEAQPTSNDRGAIAGRPQATSSGSKARKQVKKKGVDKTQRYLFVMFDNPGPETNQALGQLFSDVKAFYEADLGVYHIPPGPEGYPLTVANASSPGKLPALHKDGDYDPVQGISVLIKFINSRRVSNSPESLIRFTQQVADIGGQILDFERKPVTDKTFAELRGEEEA